jgi:hypothetical protein
MTTSSDVPPAAPARPDNLKPVTIQIRDDILQKLKVVAILQDSTVSDLLADAAAHLVKRDLKKLIAKLESAG